MKKIILLLIIPFLGFGQDCSCIDKSIDKFTSEISYRAKSTGLIKDQITLSKSIKEGDTVYYIIVDFTSSSSISASAYDNPSVIFLFENNIKETVSGGTIKFNTVYSGLYYYYVFARVNKELVENLSKNKVTDFRIYVYDFNHLKKNRDKLITKATCILKA